MTVGPYTYATSFYRKYGHKAYTLITAPATEPVSVIEAKRHLKIDATDMDVEIGTFITTARQQVERDANVALLQQTWDIAFDEAPCGLAIRLDLAPLQTVTYVKYYDNANTLQTLASTNYIVDAASVPPRIGLAPNGTWPTDLRMFQPLLVRAVFGWTTAPPPLVHAMKLLLGLYDQHREPTSAERSSYDALIEAYAVRVW